MPWHARTLLLLLVEHVPRVDAEVIEAQLAHAKDGELGAAYDRAEFMAKRKALMQAWADYLDRLKAGAQAIEIRTGAPA